MYMNKQIWACDMCYNERYRQSINCYSHTQTNNHTIKGGRMDKVDWRPRHVRDVALDTDNGF